MAINTGIIKSYAPQARLDFIEAVKARAARFGITEKGFSDIQEQGDVAIINGQAYPRALARQRRDLETKIRRHGFVAVMEEVAYTWFNRFAAIRFMELHGYLEHGFRVLSHPAGEGTPEIIQNAEAVDLPGLRKAKVIDLKLEGGKDEELYRMLLVAQCNALHNSMPFLFERIEDETELLLPDNLLHSDSVIRQMVQKVPEVDWQEIEIIGWLYQFYISEKKDEVMGKVVRAEDIPAATQLFTPNWIVKYMVQNSLGAKWLATYPKSALREKMTYYIAPDEQSVQEQDKAATPPTLDPEKLTFLDPASGSGHILVEAYDLFKEIYLERGYRPREIPRLILEKNIYGLDIGDRAAQLSGFALMMKARADDRRILSDDNPVKLNVLSIQESKDLNADEIKSALLPAAKQFDLLSGNDLLPDTLVEPNLAVVENGEMERSALTELIQLFADAKTLGSLISVPPPLFNKLSTLNRLLQNHSGDDSVSLIGQGHTTHLLAALLHQAQILGRGYDVICANPPYMNAKYFCGTLKSFAKANFVGGQEDICACFIEWCVNQLSLGGFASFIVIPNWMFISSFAEFRRFILENTTVQSLSYNGRGIWGSDFGSVAFSIRRGSPDGFQSKFRKLFEKNGEVQNIELLRQKFLTAKTHLLSQSQFFKIPTQPFAFWIRQDEIDAYANGRTLDAVSFPKKGMDTGENAKFLRFWYEIDHQKFSADDITAGTWVPYNKGGDQRKWYGNREWVLNYASNGADLRRRSSNKTRRPNLRNQDFYGREGYTWTTVTMSPFSCRYSPPGAVFDNGGATVFADSDLSLIGAYLNSKVAKRYLDFLSPSVNYQSGDIGRLLFNFEGTDVSGIGRLASTAIQIAKDDWNASELSWEFSRFPWLAEDIKSPSLAETQAAWAGHCNAQINHMIEVERDINATFIEAYNLSDEMKPEPDIGSITLARTC